jgi:hypothetical protein
MRPHSAATKAPPSGRPLVFSLGPVGAVRLLGNDALGAKSARIGEHGRPIFGDVLVEQDAGLGIAQQPRQAALRSRNGRLRKSSPSCSIKSKA